MISIIVAVGCVIQQDDFAMKEISRRLAEAILKEHSGLIPGPGSVLLHGQFDDFNDAYRELTLVLGMHTAALASLTLVEMAAYFQNVESRDWSWVDKRINLIRLFENTAKILNEFLETDQNHYMYNQPISVNMNFVFNV